MLAESLIRQNDYAATIERSFGNGNGNRKEWVGIPWEWELVTKLGMGMERNVNWPCGNGGGNGNVKSHSRSSLLMNHLWYWNLVLSGPLPNSDNFFVITDYHLGNVFQVDATSGVTSQLLPVGVPRNLTSLVHDPTTKLFYWTDSHAHTINRYSLLTNISTVIYRDPSNNGKDT